MFLFYIPHQVGGVTDLGLHFFLAVAEIVVGDQRQRIVLERPLEHRGRAWIGLIAPRGQVVGNHFGERRDVAQAEVEALASDGMKAYDMPNSSPTTQGPSPCSPRRTRTGDD